MASGEARHPEAAEQGHAKAQFDLVLCYDVGAGVPEDALLAFRWYRKAEQSNAEAIESAEGNHPGKE